MRLTMDDARALYLDLMKRTLTNWVYGHHETAPVPFSSQTKKSIVEFFSKHGLQVVRPQPMDPRRRALGDDWPPTAHTMIGFKRLDNVQFCVESALAEGVPGDLMETGVWRGGTTIFMRAILKAHGVTDRTVWVADSFEGLPKPDVEKYPQDAGSKLYEHKALAVPLDEVRSNFERYGLLDEQVRFLKGWFKDTLPTAPIERLAVLRLDGDMYESTMDALSSLYPKLSPGGYLLVDDYRIESCRQAIQDYRKAHDIHDEMVEVDWTGVYWRRSE